MLFTPANTGSIRFNDIFKELEVVSAPYAGIPAVSLNQLKQHCRIAEDITDEDNVLTTYCHSAEKIIEDVAEITLRQKTYKLRLARWPYYSDYCIIRLEYPPVISVTSVTYYDDTDTLQTLSPSNYEVWLNRLPPSIIIPADKVPSTSLQRSKAIEILFDAGYTTDIPSTARLAILELVAFWFQNREAYGRTPSAGQGSQAILFNSLVDSLRWRMYP